MPDIDKINKIVAAMPKGTVVGSYKYRQETNIIIEAQCRLLAEQGYRKVDDRSELMRVVATAIIEWEINKTNLISLADYITDKVYRWLLEGDDE